MIPAFKGAVKDLCLVSLNGKLRRRLEFAFGTVSWLILKPYTAPYNNLL